jgi:hydroxyacylglutathione hydrolase
VKPYHTLQYNPFGENTYIVFNEKNDCIIIDAGCYDEKELQHLYYFIENKKLNPIAVINTHGHIDHIFGVNDVCTHFNLVPFIHIEEEYLLKIAASQAQMFGLSLTSMPERWNYITEDSTLNIEGFNIQTLHIPGHSKGSIVLYFKDISIAVTGDVLFNGSIGRTDLPGGNYDQLISGIRSKLLTLPQNTVVLPGHGPSTTIGEEIANNQFLNHL